MKELLIESLNNANLLTTGLLAFTGIYWLVVFLGVLDISSFDVDIDTDIDLDVDADVDLDTEVEAGEGMSDSVSWINNILLFFNLKYVPLMVFLTFLFFPMWLISLSINHYLGNETFLISIIFLIPNLIVSLFIAKFATIPVSKVFQRLEEDTEATDPIGKIAEVRLPIKPNKMGQVVIKDINSNVVNLNAITNLSSVIEKGTKVLVIQYDLKERAFLVEPYQ